MIAVAAGALIRGAVRRLGNEVNTDLHCSTKYHPGKDTAFAAARAFEELAPGFAQRFGPGDVIVAGSNFGINSSREQATQALRMLGCAAIVARSFGRQFFRNCINNGLPVVECALPELQDGETIEVDLAAGRVLARDTVYAVAVLPAEVRAIVAAGGLHAFLRTHPDWTL